MEGRKYDMIQRLLHVSGEYAIISSLPWSGMDPFRHAHRRVQAKVRVLGAEAVHFTADAIIQPESTTTEENFSLKALISPEDHAALSQAIRQFGIEPQGTGRKYPRIPADRMIELFPVYVLGHLKGEAPKGSPVAPLVFKLGNMSPQGMLLVSQASSLDHLFPGCELELQIEPRGDFKETIELVAEIRRVSEDVDPKTDAITRHFGVKYTQITDQNKAHYLQLLKLILGTLKAKMAQAG